MPRFIYLFLHMSVQVQLFQQFFENTILSPLKCLCSFVKNQLLIFLLVYFWALSMFHNSVSILSSKPRYLDFCKFYKVLKSGSGGSSNFVLSRYCVNYSWHFVFPYAFYNQFVCILLIVCWAFDNGCKESTDELERTDVLPILCLPIYLLILYLIFFISVL